MRNLKDNILKIKKIKKRIRFLRRRKIENLREINFNISIINRKDIIYFLKYINLNNIIS